MPIVQDYILHKKRLRDKGSTVLSSAARLETVPGVGEIVYDSETGLVYVGDGVTLGGNPINTSVPNFLSIGDWTDELQDVFEIGVWTR